MFPCSTWPNLSFTQLKMIAVIVSSCLSTSPFAVVSRILLTPMSNCHHVVLLFSEGHLIHVWNFPTGTGRLLGGTGHCGVLPGRAPPASHQDQILCTALYIFPLPALHPGLVYFQALLVLGGSLHCCP